MKKPIIILAIMIAGTIISLLTSCSEDNEMETVQKESNTVIFEDRETREHVSPSPFENHVYRIEMLSSNAEMDRIVEEVQNATGELEELNIYGIKKFYLNNSDGVMYSIPYMRGENAMIVYRFGNLFQVAKAEFVPAENGITHFRLRTPDNALYYGLSIRNESEIGEFIFEDNSMINNFSNQVYTMQHAGLETGNKKGTNVTCCRKSDSWADCVECTTSALTKTWYGQLGLALAGREIIASIAISCIGAGPDAMC